MFKCKITRMEMAILNAREVRCTMAVPRQGRNAVMNRIHISVNSITMILYIT